MHSHILPGVDDGAVNQEESLAMLKIASAEGITDIVATPHFQEGKPSATPEEIAESVRTVQAAAEKHGIPVRLYPGNEILYFNGLPQCLREGRVCTLNRSQYVLIEFLPNVQFRNMQNAAENILTAGYIPVLAHAERYMCLVQNREYLEFFRDIGVRIQMNAGSMIGRSGSEVRHFVREILKTGLVDYIGTDAHGSRHRRPEIAKCEETLIKKYGQIYAEAILRDNAAETLGIAYLR